MYLRRCACYNVGFLHDDVFLCSGSGRRTKTFVAFCILDYYYIVILLYSDTEIRKANNILLKHCVNKYWTQLEDCKATRYFKGESNHYIDVQQSDMLTKLNRRMAGSSLHVVKEPENVDEQIDEIEVKTDGPHDELVRAKPLGDHIRIVDDVSAEQDTSPQGKDEVHRAAKGNEYPDHPREEQCNEASE